MRAYTHTRIHTYAHTDDMHIYTSVCMPAYTYIRFYTHLEEYSHLCMPAILNSMQTPNLTFNFLPDSFF